MKEMRKGPFIIVICSMVLLVIFCVWQNNDLVVSNYVYNNSKITEGLDGYKIVQISDLHNKEFGKSSKRLLQIIDIQQPNLIAITGDMVDSRHTNIEDALEFVEGAVKIAPVYYVTGNHEQRLNLSDKNELLEGLKKAGVILLNNKVVEITRGKESFYLIGLEDNNLSDDTLEKIMVELTEAKLNVLLAHEPQYLDLYSATNVDLVFAGHAHGGQFRLPYIGGMVAPDQGFFPKYTAGTYVEDNTTMIVSRGLGNSIVPLRIFNRPEVVVTELKADTFSRML